MFCKLISSPPPCALIFRTFLAILDHSHFDHIWRIYFDVKLVLLQTSLTHCVLGHCFLSYSYQTHFYLKHFAIIIPLSGMLFSDFLYGLFAHLSNVPWLNITPLKSLSMSLCFNLPKMAPLSTPFVTPYPLHQYIFKGMPFVIAIEMHCWDLPLKQNVHSASRSEVHGQPSPAPPSGSVSAF